MVSQHMKQIDEHGNALEETMQHYQRAAIGEVGESAAAVSAALGTLRRVVALLLNDRAVASSLASLASDSDFALLSSSLNSGSHFFNLCPFIIIFMLEKNNNNRYVDSYHSLVVTRNFDGNIVVTWFFGSFTFSSSTGICYFEIFFFSF